MTPACLRPVPAESRRVKLQGILADLRDVDGLPPKVTGPPPGTPQPRPHEGKRPLHPGPVLRGPRQREAAEAKPQVSVSSGSRPSLWSAASLSQKFVCLSLSPSLFVCPALSVCLALPVSFFPAVILDLVLSLPLCLPSHLSLPLSVSLSLPRPLSAPSLPSPYQVPLASPQTFSSWTLSGAGR